MKPEVEGRVKSAGVVLESRRSFLWRKGKKMKTGTASGDYLEIYLAAPFMYVCTWKQQGLDNRDVCTARQRDGD